MLYGRGRGSTPHSVCKSEFQIQNFFSPRKMRLAGLYLSRQGCTSSRCSPRILGTCRPQEPIHRSAALLSDVFSSQSFLLRGPAICFAASCASKIPNRGHHTSKAMKHQLIIFFPFRYNNNIMYSSDHIRSCGWNMGAGASLSFSKNRGPVFQIIIFF